jgi:hypothetical protein
MKTEPITPEPRMSEGTTVSSHPTRLPLFASSPEAALGSALVDVFRQLLQEEFRARLPAAPTPPPSSRWMTPPAAARTTGVPVKSIRAWLRSGRIAKRVRNCSADPKQQKYLVNIDDVVAVAEQAGGGRGDASELVDMRERARARAQEILAARAAKER